MLNFNLKGLKNIDLDILRSALTRELKHEPKERIIGGRICTWRKEQIVLLLTSIEEEIQSPIRNDTYMDEEARSIVVRFPDS